MLPFSSPALLVTGGLLLGWPPLAAAEWPQGETLDDFIAAEQKIALTGVLANIGPNGTKVPGAGAGIVIASPTKSNPNYFYTWTRDAALTLKTLVDEFMFGNADLQPYIEDYIHSQAVIQTVTNPSGTLLPNGAGLGEPKYNADGSRYNGNWGRPQRDGPPLRATALIQYSNYLISNGELERVNSTVWPVISNDLNYVGQYWNSTGFDLWEEVSGSSFFTTHSQYRSLVEGAELAKTLGIPCPSCEQAPRIICFLQSAYWNDRYFTANINGGNGRSGVDANTVLAAINGFDINASCDSPTLQPCHSRMLANFKVFADAFRDPDLYPINAGIPSTSGVALGRYPEDIYYTGNPWYLTTLAAAEFLYDAAARWSKQGFVAVDDTSLSFFQDLYPSAQANKTYSYKQHEHKGKNHKGKKKGKKNTPCPHPSPSTSPFQTILTAATAYADTFVSLVQAYTPPSGSLSEQFVKDSPAPGTQTSAFDLTWSYAAFLTMSRRREGTFPPSWAPSSLPSSPSTCPTITPSPPPGTYAPATSAGAPNITLPLCTSTVRFMLNATTYYGENVYLSGNITDLGGWDLGTAVPMRSSNYTSARPLWFVDVPFVFTEESVGERVVVEYKYAREQDCGQGWIWEALSENRTLAVPSCEEGDGDGDDGEVVLETDEAWVGEGGSSGGC